MFLIGLGRYLVYKKISEETRLLNLTVNWLTPTQFAHTHILHPI